MTFQNKLQRAILETGSVLSVGLDPDLQKLPAPVRQMNLPDEEKILHFCQGVIRAANPYAAVFKINVAFFEALGSEGWRVMEQVVKEVRQAEGNPVLIADAKRGDIGSTAEKYKEAFFDRLDVDAITLNIIMGLDTMKPFLDDDSKAVFALALTSNTGSADFLQRRFQGRLSLSEYIAEELEKIDSIVNTEIGLVIGATQSDLAVSVLKKFPRATLLIPGVGVQGGDVEDVAALLKHHKGTPIIHSSRSVIYAGGDREDWEDRVREAAKMFKQRFTGLYEVE
ncbi:MAG: orotidine-5'-phosphate decarboxylase [Bacteroidetes bacterium]|nr:MAG: orotidine-5'-phosphate decarboxylase [Bacteroidota bacterium]